MHTWEVASSRLVAAFEQPGPVTNALMAILMSGCNQSIVKLKVMDAHSVEGEGLASTTQWPTKHRRWRPPGITMLTTALHMILHSTATIKHFGNAKHVGNAGKPLSKAELVGPGVGLTATI